MNIWFINPGTGSLSDATEANATQNMAAFIADTIPALTYTRLPDRDYEGRFGYQVVHPDYPGKPCKVEMPGWELERVRWMDEPEQNIWHYPRLYVDGSSWVWKYAMSALIDFWEGNDDTE